MKKWLMALVLPTSILVSSLAPISSALAATQVAVLGDLTSFERIATDTLVLVDKGELKAAEKRITDFETAWDKAEPTLRPKGIDQWSTIDDAADAAIASLRNKNPDASKAQTSISALIDTLKNGAAE